MVVSLLVINADILRMLCARYFNRFDGRSDSYVMYVYTVFGLYLVLYNI